MAAKGGRREGFCRSLRLAVRRVSNDRRSVTLYAGRNPRGDCLMKERPPDKWARFPYYHRVIAPSEDTDTMPGVRLTDFASCLPPATEPGGWTLISYETAAFSGTLLHAAADTSAPELSLPLNIQGWHAVYVWLMGGDAETEALYPEDFDSVYSQSFGPKLRLSGETRWSKSFRTMSHDRMMWRGLEAVFWQYADLSGQDLLIGHQGHTVYIGAMECVPLSAAEVAALQAKRDSKRARRIIIKGDHPKREDVDTLAANIRHRQVKAWIVGNECDKDLYAPEFSPDLTYARKAAHGAGAEFYICDRPSLWSSHREEYQSMRRDFFKAHPEWRCLERDGTPTHQMSYAVPEVVEHMLKRLRLSARNQPDGYGLFFNRDPGLVWFEPAAMEGFAEVHGVDPLILPDDDDRLLRWRAEIITSFLRRCRKELDVISTENRWPRLRMAAVVLGDETANRLYSYDVRLWIQEGLVDLLMPYPWSAYPDRWLAQGFVDYDVSYFASLTRGTDCELYPMWLNGIWRRHWTPEHVRVSEYFPRAMRDYEAGADGIANWDFIGLNRPPAFMSDRYLRLGQKELLPEWIAADFPLPPKVLFTKYNGETPDRFPAGTGG